MDEYIDYILVVSSDQGHNVYAYYNNSGIVFLKKYKNYKNAETYAEDLAEKLEIHIIYSTGYR